MSIEIRKKWRRILAGTLAALLLTGSVPGMNEVYGAQTENVLTYDAEGQQKITGFEGLSAEQESIYIAKKVALELLVARMPASIDVKLEGTGTVSIPVTWECVGDYENSNYFYYQFNPKWDTTKYVQGAGTAGEIPYIGVFIGRDSSLKLASRTENQETIYKFMKDEMGFNTAAACGVLANIQAESSFNPAASVIDTNGLTSYGICQWNGVRFDALKSYCNEKGYDYTSLKGQLKYLKYELQNSEARACSMVKNVENTAEGAWNAGYNWARYFERCASENFEVRGNLARDTYWPIYGGGAKRTKYTVTYDLDGGENDDDNPNYYYNTSDTITLKNPSKKGYTFDGWYKNKAMTQKITSIPKGSEGNLKLYAKWLVNHYTIEFSGNGATSGSMASMKDCEYDSIYTLSKNKFERSGYKFAGWNTKKDGSGTAYSNREDVENLSAKDGKVITLYAQWTKSMYTITYQLNGGTQSEKNPTKYDVNTKTFTLKKPTRKGYTFEGWYKESTFKTEVTKIEKGTTGNLKLYAKWKVNKYKIVYKGNGATSGSMADVTTCKYGKKYTLVSNKFKRTGYTFTGWNTAADGSGRSYKDKEQVKNLAASNNKTITLYAQWKRKVYTIQYELNGGIMGTKSNPTKYYVNTKTFKLNAPEREGYTFKGWYTEKNFKNKITQIKKGTQKNYKLYAKWQINKYEIQFDGNGAKSGKMESITGCKYGKSYTLPENSFQRKGYRFIGWNTAADGTGTFYQNQAKVLNLSLKNGETVTLYAQWELDD